MKPTKEQTLNEQCVYDGVLFTVNHDKIRGAEGRESYRDVVTHKYGGVAILAITPDGKIPFVTQYRYAYRDFLVELPAGKLERGEEPSECASRELQEETGYTAGKLSHLLTLYPSPGYVNETLYVYLAEDLTTGIAHPDEGESLSVTEYTLDEALRLIDNGTIKDGKTVAGVLALVRIRTSLT